MQIFILKELFPLTTREILGFILLGLVIGLANAGGIGGGYIIIKSAIIVPILQSVFLYNLKKSIYIGFVTILAGAFGNYFKFAFVRNE